MLLLTITTGSHQLNILGFRQHKASKATLRQVQIANRLAMVAISWPTQPASTPTTNNSKHSSPISWMLCQIDNIKLYNLWLRVSYGIMPLDTALSVSQLNWALGIRQTHTHTHTYAGSVYLLERDWSVEYSVTQKVYVISVHWGQYPSLYFWFRACGW